MSYWGLAPVADGAKLYPVVLGTCHNDADGFGTGQGSFGAMADRVGDPAVVCRVHQRESREARDRTAPATIRGTFSSAV